MVQVPSLFGAGVDLFGAGLNTNGAGVNTFGAGLNTNGAGAIFRAGPAPQNAILRSTVAQAPAKKSHLHQIARHLHQINPHLHQIARPLLQINPHLRQIARHLLQTNLHLHQIAKHLLQINPHLRQIARPLHQTNLQKQTPSPESNLVRTIRREPRSNAKRASRVCPFRHGHRREPCTCRLLRAKPFRCKV